MSETQRKTDHPAVPPEVLAAHAFVESMVLRADDCDPYPLWYGWALKEAYLKGRADASAELERLRVENASLSARLAEAGERPEFEW